MTGPRSDLVFAVLGRAFRARGVDETLAGWLRRHWRFPEHARPAHPYDITLEQLDAAPPPDSGEPCAVRLHGGVELHWRNEGVVWRSGSDDAGVRLELGGTESRIAVWGAERSSARDGRRGGFGRGAPRHRPSERSGAGLFAALYLAICEALRASGLLPLHAAVAVRDGRATVFAGSSGTGKSTTLVRALRAGWRPLAEDLSWLDPGALTLYGWDRGIRLWPEARDRFAAELDGDWATDPDGKLFLGYDQLDVPPARSATLERLAVLLRDDDDDSGWEPLAPRDAVRALWEATGVPLGTAARQEASRRIPELLGSVEMRRLRLGRTPPPL